MKHITAGEIKGMTETEGLVLQGCGGDPAQWVSGINQMLTDEGILLDGDTFKDVYIFQHEGTTNMLFSMEDVKLDIGKLAMWRLASHDTFGGTWLSDYIPNRLEAVRAELPVQKPDLQAIYGEEGYPISARLMGANPDLYIGIWHGFPTTTERLQATLKQVGIPASGELKCESYATDSFVRKHLPDTIAVRELDELNYLAARVGEMSTEEREVFEAVMEAGLHCNSLQDIINVVQNLDKFGLQPAENAEHYGEFLIETEKDNTFEIFNRLEQSSNPDERAFAQYVLRLESSVDEGAYGRAIAEEEQGHFTENGYLTEQNGFEGIYKGIQDIPTEYRVFVMPEPEPLLKVENTDLTVLLAKMHAVGGEYMADAHYNLCVLESKRSAEYLMVMNGRSVFLTEAAHAYRRGTTAFDAILTADESPDTRAFALHVTDMHAGHVTGDLVEVNIRELQLDVLHCSIHPVQIDAKSKFGEDISFTPEEWAKQEPTDRDRLESWTRRFDPADSQSVIRHLDDVSDSHAQSRENVSPDKVLSDLNTIYMAKAECKPPDMLRVPLAAAKDMLSHSDTSVYRLLPEGAKELSPLDAMQSRGGLWFQEHCEFAVKKADAVGLGKWASRAADAAVKATQVRDTSTPDKTPKPKEPEL